MKSPNLNLALITLLSLALLPVHGNFARAELEDQEVVEDSIVPESSDTLADQGEAVLHEEVIVRKKRPSYKKARAPKRRVIIQEVEASEEDVSSDNAAQPVAAASVGSTIDNSIDKKLSGARAQIEGKIAEAIDGIQITIGNGSAPAAATVVQDQTVTVNAAPALNEKAYLTTEEAPGAEGAESQAELGSEAPLKGQMSLTPMFGLSTISSGKTGGYNPESEYSAGLGLEVELSDSMSFMGSYRFAKYNIRLASPNQFPIYGNYGNIYAGYGGVNQSLNSLKYSQNSFDASLRLYLLPKEYRYRFFVGGGMGYQRGYLNYSDRTLDLLKTNPALRSSGYLDDYEITQILFNAEAGGEVSLSKAIAIGGLFRYSTVVSSSTQDAVNSSWYNNSGFTQYGQASDKTIVGSSLANSGFYTILGTLKYTF